MVVYLSAPIIAWLVGQTAKRVVHFVTRGTSPMSLQVYGGMPSTHSTIVGTSAVLIGLEAGLHSPVFYLAMTLAFVVIIDALALRRHLGDHAKALNVLMKDSPGWTPLRERVYHTPAEVFAGLALGTGLALVLHLFV